MPLEPEDQKHLIAAQGYVELGMFLDADTELDEIDPGVRHLPEVLGVSRVCGEAWEAMDSSASRKNRQPVHRPRASWCGTKMG
jgi:hypothetical protein